MKSTRQRGPGDPDRPARIARAVLNVATENGLGKLSHRTVADRAGVPLGSTTYHYSGLHDLVAAGMREAVIEFRQEAEGWSSTLTTANIVPKLASWIQSQIEDGSARDRTVVWFELCVMAMRFDDLKEINHEWDSILPAALEAHVGPALAHAYNVTLNGILLDALIHGRTPVHSEIEALLGQVTVP